MKPRTDTDKHRMAKSVELRAKSQKRRTLRSMLPLSVAEYLREGLNPSPTGDLLPSPIQGFEFSRCILGFGIDQSYSLEFNDSFIIPAFLSCAVAVLLI